MKNGIVLLLCLLFMFSFCACDLNPLVNRINGNEASVKEQQEEYTKLADGTYLYERSKASSENMIQFKDEENNVLLDSSDILFVSAKWSEYNGYYIQLEFTEEGTADFAKATGENIGKEIRIVSGEQILSSPVVNAEITDGIAIIANCEGYDEIISLFNKLVE